jgi:hypothetical protein
MMLLTGQQPRSAPAVTRRSPGTKDHVIDLNPATCFHARPGDDGVLISRTDIRRWVQAIESTTDRLRARVLGISTEGRPIDAIFIGADLDGDGLEKIEARRGAAVDGLLSGERYAGWDRPVVLITSGIHATEVGGPQSIIELIHWLVFGETPDVRTIRERILTIIVPTLNPDGMDLVQRWHNRTAGTDRAGSLPPLLYHRHAGHDNNRDWIFRNLAETRVVLDQLHRRWLPHVTLDQHQMNPQGPRFALPPYADPWEPHIHPAIIAASSALGQAIAADLTRSGKAGVMTGRYFDAWEPSRAIQHYRGGVRILAEAASANLASPITISADQLANPPLPQADVPTTSAPFPWDGGTWRLRDIVDYHLDAAKSLLRQVVKEPERWPTLQRDALGRDDYAPISIQVPQSRPALDIAANQRLAEILDAAGLVTSRQGARYISSSTASPLGPLTGALLMPKTFPEAQGANSYDITTHHLPLYTGAIVSAAPTNDAAGSSRPRAGRWLVVDARSHRAPELAELALRRDRNAAHRATKSLFAGDTLIQPGAWLIDGRAIPAELHGLAHASVDAAPDAAVPVSRRDVVLAGLGNEPAADHGWTRWWLEHRQIPFLEADGALIGSLGAIAATTTLLIADTARAALPDREVRALAHFVKMGGHAIAIGRTARALVTEIAPLVTVSEFEAGGPVHAPGALVRLQPAAGHSISLGLDRSIPAMFQRDGIFRVPTGATNVTVLGRFAAHDTVVSGWMSDASALRDASAIVEVRHGAGTLHAFAFKPLFRAQMLVTAPLLHNLLYATQEVSSCRPFDREKTPASGTSDRTS